MNIIAAVDREWGIGKNNHLLAHIPEDMKHFKEMTLGKTVVMGANTFLSLPNGALPARHNLVLSSKLKALANLEVFSSLDALIEALKKIPDNEIFIIGGSQIYHQFLPFCKTAFITKINQVFNADTFFPNLDIDKDWTLVKESEKVISNNFEITFLEYQNLSYKI